MKKVLPAFLAALVFSSCAPLTPQARIDQNPQKFATLTKKEQNLARQGQIAHGMSPTAVEIAWGLPSQRFEGYKDGKSTERWDYTGSKPVYSTSFYSGWGYGPYGPYGRYSTLGYGIGPEVVYVPYRMASVWFINNRVDAWELNR